MLSMVHDISPCQTTRSADNVETESGSKAYRDPRINDEVDALRLKHVEHHGGLRQLQLARARLHMHAAAQQRPVQPRQHCLSARRPDTT